MYKVDATIQPELFYLRDLMNHPVSGSFYRQQLFLAPKPSLDLSFFEVEDVIFKRKFNGKTYYYVKFLFYPDKFNKYVTYQELKKTSI